MLMHLVTCPCGVLWMLVHRCTDVVSVFSALGQPVQRCLCSPMWWQHRRGLEACEGET
jgi:hypothetical protein